MFELDSYNQGVQFNNNFDMYSVSTELPPANEWVKTRDIDNNVQDLYFKDGKFYDKNSNVCYPTFWKFKKPNS